MLFDFLKSKKQSEPEIKSGGIKPVVLIVIDGYGIAPPSEGNAVTQAKTPNLDRYYSRFPNGELLASGESVGLPANEVGNSEVGHLVIGAGSVIPQSLKRINAAIKDETFYENEAFAQTINHAQKNNSNLHLIGLVSTGSVHSSIDHFYALLELARRKRFTRVFCHLFTDGRDAPPKAGVKLIEEMEKKTKSIGIGQIASVMGRYFSMDRDMRWERTQKAYEAIVLGKGVLVNSASEALNNSYAKNKTDEFVEPVVIAKDGQPVATINDNDAVIFFNFRVDRPRQLTMAFVKPDFENLKPLEVESHYHETEVKKKVFKGHTFKREKWPKNLFFTTMTEYQKNVKVSAVAFTPLKAKISLSEILSQNGLKQLHLAESEKERMVTTYFNGLHEGRFPGEEVQIIPSPKVATYDKKPEMSVYEITNELKKALSKNEYHFYILNFANPDMVSHSGNVKATIKAMEHVDKALGEAVEAVLATDGTLVITADHGNAEELLTFPTSSFYFTSSEGEVNTDHSNNPVPILIISNQLAGKAIKLPQGTLVDVAPTILTLMGLPIPKEMEGQDLFKQQPKDQPVVLSSSLPRIEKTT